MFCLHPAIFLDRDGVLIENRPHYVRSWQEVEIFPQALQALARLADSPFKIVVITNQAGIGKGLISLDTAAQINHGLVTAVEQAGGRIDAVYMCPHTPEEACSCRKPQPGLILQAAGALDLDLPRSLLVGDAASDLLAGRAAGVGRLALVRTGRGRQQVHAAELQQALPYQVFEDLSGALAGMTW